MTDDAPAARFYFVGVSDGSGTSALFHCRIHKGLRLCVPFKCGTLFGQGVRRHGQLRQSDLLFNVVDYSDSSRKPVTRFWIVALGNRLMLKVWNQEEGCRTQVELNKDTERPGSVNRSAHHGPDRDLPSGLVPIVVI